MMCRLVLLPVAVLVGMLVVGCGAPGDADATLPPMRTTTSTTTTTTTPDDRRKFYQVKPGDTLAAIAAGFKVPISEIVKLNALPDGGEHLEVGQTIEIPTDMVLVDLSTTTTGP